MARRLVDAGHRLTVWDLDPQRREALVELGASAVGTPAEAVAGAEWAITMVADPAALNAVVLGRDGVAAGMASGQTLIEMSTVGPAAVMALRSRLDAGIDLVDAPVRGSLPEAEAGSLVVMVGATVAQFARARELLSALGTPIRVGDLGAGAATKLAVNLSLGGVMTALGEALGLATALGVDRTVALDVLSECPWGGLLRNRRPMIDSGQYPAQLKLGLAAKDFRLIRDAASASGTRIPVAGSALAWFEEACSRLGAELDFAAVVAAIGAAPAGDPPSFHAEREDPGPAGHQGISAGGIAGGGA